MIENIDNAELYRLVQAQQPQLAQLPPTQPVSRNLLDSLGIGVLVPLSPFVAKMGGYAALMYGSYQLYKAGERLEDREMGVPELYRYPREVQKRVRAAYAPALAEKRRQDMLARAQQRRQKRAVDGKWWRR